MSKNRLEQNNRMNRFLTILFFLTLPITAKGVELLDYNVEARETGALIHLHFSGPVPRPVGVFLPAPPRLYFDFPDARNESGRLSIKTQTLPLKEVRMGKQADGIRVVLDLARAIPHQVQVDGNTVLIALGDDASLPAKTATLPSKAKPEFKASPTAQKSHPPIQVKPSKVQIAQAATQASVSVPAQIHLPDTVVSQARKPSLLQVDFRKEGHEGRIVFRTSATPERVSTIAQQNRLTVQIEDTEVPVHLVRRFDVRDFGTLVKHIDVVPKGFAALANIQINGGFTHVLKKEADAIEILVTPLQEAVGLTSEIYQGKKLSLDFQDIDVRSVLQVFADFTGLNVVVGDSVGGRISIRLKDVPWDEALDTILRVKNLGKRQIGNTIWIAPLDEMRAQEEGGELPTEVFRLKYQKAEAVANLLLGSVNMQKRHAPSEDETMAGILPSFLGMQQGKAAPGVDKSNAMISEKGRVLVDARTNTLFVQEAPTRIEAIRKLISIIDIPQRQVMIESRIVIAEENFARELGARLGFKHVERSPGQFYSVGGSGEDTAYPITGSPDGSFNPIESPGVYNVDLPANAIGQSNPGVLALSIIRGDARNANLLNLELSALESDRRGKIVSSPKVFTANLQTAYIEQGMEIPYREQVMSQAGLGGTSVPYSTVSFKKAVLRLDVTPQITPDNRLLLDLEVTKDEAGTPITPGMEPPINTRKVSTQVEVNNGDTAVLGGVFELNNTDTITKIPYLGDVPLLGALFRTKSRTEEKTELLIFITPRIMPDIPPENL